MRPAKLALLLPLAVVVPLVSVSLRATAETSVAPLSSPAASSALAVPSPEAAPASASVSAPASASGKPRTPTVGERLAREPLPEKPTRMPTVDEWKHVAVVAPDQGGSSQCELRLRDEWLQLYCGTGSIVDVSLVAGDSGKDVALTLVEGEFGNHDGSAIVPLRRGRSLVVTMTSVFVGRYSSGLPETSALLYVTWRDDEPRPTVRVESTGNLG